MTKREAFIGAIAAVLGFGGSVFYEANNPRSNPLLSIPVVDNSYTLTLTNSDGSIAESYNLPPGQSNTTHRYTSAVPAVASSAVPAVVSAPSSNAIPLITPYSSLSISNISELERQAVEAASMSFPSNILEQVKAFNASSNFAAIITGDNGIGYLTRRKDTNVLLLGDVVTNGVSSGLVADMKTKIDGETVISYYLTNGVNGTYTASFTNPVTVKPNIYPSLQSIVTNQGGYIYSAQKVLSGGRVLSNVFSGEVFYPTFQVK